MECFLDAPPSYFSAGSAVVIASAGTSSSVAPKHSEVVVVRVAVVVALADTSEAAAYVVAAFEVAAFEVLSCHLEGAPTSVEVEA